MEEHQWTLTQSRIPKLNPTLPLDTDLVKIEKFENDFSNLELSPEFKQAIFDFSALLNDSVRKRLENIPARTPSSLPRLAILFSGGLDCSTLAALAHSHIPEDEPIDLLNVAFENDKTRKRDSIFDVPDRLTGLQSLQELQSRFPTRVWNFVKINVTRDEYDQARARIIALMTPLTTVMDLVRGFKLILVEYCHGSLVCCSWNGHILE